MSCLSSLIRRGKALDRKPAALKTLSRHSRLELHFKVKDLH